MGKALADAFPSAKATFEEVDDALGVSLSAIMWDGEESVLQLTENTQPALVAVSMAVVRVLEQEFDVVLKDKVSYVAGHSLGEYAAACAAGVFTLADAVRLVRTRGASHCRKRG